MKAFMGDDFLLDTETARTLFREGAQDTPIFDWHCHLSPKEIYENREPEDIAALWLGGDLLWHCGAIYYWQRERV